MSKDTLLRRCRPYLFSGFRRSQCLPTARAFSSSSRTPAVRQEQDVTHDYEKRVAQLQAQRSLSDCYPRLPSAFSEKHRRKAAELESEHGETLKSGETATEREVAIAGRVKSVRTAGSKLLFIDLQDLSGTIQIVCQLGKLQEHNGDIDSTAFKALSKLIRKGDSYSVVGYPHRTARGEFSLLATALPVLVSPSLHQIPESLDDPEARARARHVDMLVNPEAIQTLQVRHHVEDVIQKFFNDQGFIKVTTPLLGAGAGGAAARPFETKATELPDEALNLRIAPELWLKRLIVGGMERVYEMGPAFRNEGVDATHNPEFNICEFYQAYATLPDLIKMTMELLRRLERMVRELQPSALIHGIPKESHSIVDFLPTLQERLGTKLPDLQAPHAAEEIRGLFQEKEIPIPSNPTLPRLLDALCAQYLEPMSQGDNAGMPVFITNHPACMSPLSKHFLCPKTGQIVAARAELFISGREYANMYEEENSPFEQRRKFEEQLKLRDADKEAMEVDESYLRALEWGMPPTGGWGCGVDRLVMLLSGRERMSDVLAFGSLRNVVGLGRGFGKVARR